MFSGVLKISDLRQLIFRGERFSPALVDKYIDLMSKFEVAIKISDRYLLVPTLLPEVQRDCPKISDNLCPDLQQAMNVYAYMKHRVHRRQYLMSYVPSGFWARLITRFVDGCLKLIVLYCSKVMSFSDKVNFDTTPWAQRGLLPYWAIQDVPRFKVSFFSQKFLNRVEEFVRNSGTR